MFVQQKNHFQKTEPNMSTGNKTKIKGNGMRLRERLTLSERETRKDSGKDTEVDK